MKFTEHRSNSALLPPPATPPAGLIPLAGAAAGQARQAPRQGADADAAGGALGRLRLLVPPRDNRGESSRGRADCLSVNFSLLDIIIASTLSLCALYKVKWRAAEGERSTNTASECSCTGSVLKAPDCTRPAAVLPWVASARERTSAT